MMGRPLQEQVVVITGASSGIGREAALKFGQAGARVVLAARNETALNEVAEEIRQAGGQAHVVPTDVSQWDQVRHLAQEAIGLYGRIDTWVNDAAASIYGTVEETEVHEIDRLMQTNLLGTIYGVKAVLPYMKEQAQGTIINLGSVVSQRAVPLQAFYSASKHAIKGFTEALWLELEREKTGIRVTLILPASVNTPFFNHARSKMDEQPMPVPPVYEPALAADAIVHAAQHPKRDVYVGGASMMFTILERISPALADRFMMIGSWIFRLQKTGQPDDGRDSLFNPSTGRGRVRGDFAHLTKPSMFTPVFEFLPAWIRVALPAMLAGGVYMLLRRREA